MGSLPIRILPPTVAERIAAGEVIERPASVVKELVENSLDATATEVEVILEDGGKALIEIIDNGSGMNAENLAICVRHHATSKLKSLGDLDSLATFGFRGEALSSIAAVSDLRIVSKTPEETTAHEIKNHSPSQPVTFGHFLGSPNGTKISVQGLFSQVPARLKFLKSQRAETAYIREWLERLSLTHPETSFRLISDGKSILNLRAQTGSEGESKRVHNILGNDFSENPNSRITFSELKENSITLRLYCAQGISLPHTRKLIQIVNNRAVKDRFLQQAILSAFRQLLMPGQFPALVLFLETNPAEIDVNVHPTKAEIRFLNNQNIFSAIHSLIHPNSEKTTQPYWRASDSHTGMNFLETPSFPNQPPNQLEEIPFAFTQTEPLKKSQFNPLQDGRFLGAVFNTYLLYELDDEIGIVDQHASHERIRYEKLHNQTLQSEVTPIKQELLLPEAIRFRTEDKKTIETHLPTLEKIGFDAEFFSEDTLLFRAVPAIWGKSSLRPRLQNLVERIIHFEPHHSQKNPLLDESLFEALASEACHSSVRSGDRLDETQADALVEQLFECENPWNCPHGRPTLVRIPKTRLEEWFQRKL